MSPSAKVTDSTPYERAMSNAAAEPIMPAPMTNSFMCSSRGCCDYKVGPKQPDTPVAMSRESELGSVNENWLSAKAARLLARFCLSFYKQASGNLRNP